MGLATGGPQCTPFSEDPPPLAPLPASLCTRAASVHIPSQGCKGHAHVADSLFIYILSPGFSNKCSVPIF